MTHRELETHLQDLFEGCLGNPGFESLQEELRTNPEARECYREYLHLHHSLTFRAKGVDLLQVVPTERIRESRKSRLLKWSVPAAAASIAIGLVVSGALIRHANRPTLKFVTSPGTDLSVSHDLASKRQAASGPYLKPGSRLEIRSGTMELDFASGVRGIISGPADLTLYREDLLVLDRGTAWFQVPPDAAGFKISTPDLILSDSRAEFGIISDPSFPSEVHVFGGGLEVANRHGDKYRQWVSAGHAKAAGANGGWREIPMRRSRFLTRLPTAEPESNIIVTKEFSTNQFAYAGDIADDDLLYGIVPVTEGWNLDNNAHPDKLTDGIHGGAFEEVPGDKVQGAWTKVGATAEYYLGAGPDGIGYDITSIQSVADWVNVGFGNQAWSIEVKPVGGDWRILASVSYEPLDAQPLTGGGATKVTLTAKNGLLAGNIEAIKVTTGRVPGSVDNAFVWRELDVFGKPAIHPVPIPSGGESSFLSPPVRIFPVPGRFPAPLYFARISKETFHQSPAGGQVREGPKAEIHGAITMYLVVVLVDPSREESLQLIGLQRFQTSVNPRDQSKKRTIFVFFCMRKHTLPSKPESTRDTRVTFRSPPVRFRPAASIPS